MFIPFRVYIEKTAYNTQKLYLSSISEEDEGIYSCEAYILGMQFVQDAEIMIFGKLNGHFLRTYGFIERCDNRSNHVHAITEIHKELQPADMHDFVRTCMCYCIFHCRFSSTGVTIFFSNGQTASWNGFGHMNMMNGLSLFWNIKNTFIGRLDMFKLSMTFLCVYLVVLRVPKY